jgi:hypothetical protein
VKSLSEFVARVFDQLSLSSWLPSGVLVVWTAFIYEVDRAHSKGISGAMSSIAHWGGETVIFFGIAIVLVGTMLQAFEFPVVRWLEGYWFSRVGRGIAAPCIAMRRFRLSRHKQKAQQLETRARECAARELIALRGSAAGGALTACEAKQYCGVHPDEKDDCKPECTRDSAPVKDKISWRVYAPQMKLWKLDALTARIEEFPDKERVLPTRLGNVLRRHEDEAVVDGDPIQAVLPVAFGELSEDLQEQHDQFRSRLDLYCSLVLVWAGLSVSTITVLLDEGGTRLLAIVPAVLSVVSYKAAVVAGRKYGKQLVAIASYLNRPRSALDIAARRRKRGLRPAVS